MTSASKFRAPRLSVALVLALLFASGFGAGPSTGAPPLYKPPDGSRARPVHLIPLYDEMDEPIVAAEAAAPQVGRLPDLPFSARATCGKCHDYDTISRGWHFNPPQGPWESGRPGEPWFLVDRLTGTQLPVSDHEWRGAWKPEEAGLTPWRFTQRFGFYMPGGGRGELRQETPEPEARWEISGKLEINCLGCHNVAGRQNPSEWAIQVARENFRWAATAACGLGVVESAASAMDSAWSIADSAGEDAAEEPPSADYDESRFDSKHRVFFDLSRRPPSERCYFCHSAACSTDDPRNAWRHDTDAHIAAGMACTDCHRNGLDHMMVRGYDGEPVASREPAARTLTCEGCHLGDELKPNGQTMGGRLGAPRPQHKGLPVVHFQKMTCTACHSGPPPAMRPLRARTSRANRLGIHGKAIWETDMPFIASPVYLRQPSDQRVAPHYMMWPAYWARIKDGKAKPIPPDEVLQIAGEFLNPEKHVAEILEAMSQAETLDDAPAFVDGGKAYRLGEYGALLADECKEGLGRKAQWARWRNGDVQPLAIDVQTWEADELANPSKPPDKFQILRVLEGLEYDNAASGEPVFASQGKLYRLEALASNDATAWSKVTVAEYTSDTLKVKALWGDLSEGNLQPLAADAVKTSIQTMIEREKPNCRAAIAGILLALKQAGTANAAYLNGARIYTISDNLEAIETLDQALLEADYAGGRIDTPLWAVMKADKALPLLPDVLAEALRETHGQEKSLTGEQVRLAQQALNARDRDKGEAVYVCNERIFQGNEHGGLTMSKPPAGIGEPYAWPFAHDVRPAGQSLGARGCLECHAQDAPFFFAEVETEGPVKSGLTVKTTMLDLMGPDTKVFVRTNRFFQWLIVVTMTLLVLHMAGDFLRRMGRRRSS